MTGDAPSRLVIEADLMPGDAALLAGFGIRVVPHPGTDSRRCYLLEADD